MYDQLFDKTQRVCTFSTEEQMIICKLKITVLMSNHYIFINKCLKVHPQMLHIHEQVYTKMSWSFVLFFTTEQGLPQIVILPVVQAISKS